MFINSDEHWTLCSFTVMSIRGGHLDFHTVPRFCEQDVQLQCCFTSTETMFFKDY